MALSFPNIRILFLIISQVLSVPSQEEGEQEECDCEGVIKVTEELGGVVLNAYMVGLINLSNFANVFFEGPSLRL